MLTLIRSILEKRPVLFVKEAKIIDSKYQSNEIGLSLIIDNTGIKPGNKVNISAKILTETNEELMFDIPDHLKIHASKKNALCVFPNNSLMYQLTLVTKEKKNIINNPFVKIEVIIKYYYNSIFNFLRFYPYYTKHYYTFDWINLSANITNETQSLMLVSTNAT